MNRAILLYSTVPGRNIARKNIRVDQPLDDVADRHPTAIRENRSLVGEAFVEKPPPRRSLRRARKRVRPRSTVSRLVGRSSLEGVVCDEADTFGRRRCRVELLVEERPCPGSELRRLRGRGGHRCRGATSCETQTCFLLP